jgi:hypothetical protein
VALSGFFSGWSGTRKFRSRSGTDKAASYRRSVAGSTTSDRRNQPTRPRHIREVCPAGRIGTGQGLGIATDPVTGAFFGYGNPIPPGASVVLWGSGLGADPARDTTYTPAALAINGLSQIYVGGVPAVIQYQGASGYPGVNQINVQIPQKAPTGCFVSEREAVARAKQQARV